MDFRKRFQVDPDAKFRLAHMDPDFHGKYMSEEGAREDLERYQSQIQTLQRKLHGEGTRSLLIILQGMDTAGKDSTIIHAMSALTPLGAKVAEFKEPSTLERSHDFLWRVHAHAPRKGEIAIFNRSHYEDVLVVRVHQLVKKSVWQARYAFINDFEKMLHHDCGTTVLKFFLHISKDEQLRRFEKRLEDPARQWKISKADYEERNYWDDYMAAYEDALRRCSTAHAPWYVIPANHKWFRNLAVSQILAKTMEDLDFKLPMPRVNLEEIRQLYHAARLDSDDTNARHNGKKRKA